MTPGRHLLGLEGMGKDEVMAYLHTAESFKEILKRPIKKVPTLRGKTVVNLFFEPSTRTRISFELAEKRLSADTVNFSASTSSVLKGETLKDTVKNIEAMSMDAVVIRHSSPGAALYLAGWTNAAIINAGDGAHEHPTQGLLDLMTIRNLKKNFEGLRVAIIGDVAHSRVARSDIWGLKALGASIVTCGPGTLLPYELEKMGVDVQTNLDEALDGAAVVIVLRIQRERLERGLLPSLREYARTYGISAERLSVAQKGVTIMHPGPMNRNVEIAEDVADGPYSVILDQVTNGVAVRMAVLYALCGGESPAEALKEMKGASDVSV